MASLLLIGAVLIAAKVADEHDKKKPADATKIQSATVTCTPHEPLSLELQSVPKRDILSRRYWHGRRRDRKNLKEALDQSGRCDAPPFLYPGELQPMDRDLEFDLEKPVEPFELDGTPLGRGYLVYELPAGEVSTRREHRFS
ncbi:hypothetical protein BJX64DRAFT_294748 [Aspergillus heterothallicus]